MDRRTLFERLFGYCPCCDRWFCRGVKRRRFNAEYADEGDNYVTACRECYDDIQDAMDYAWNEYDNERIGGWTL